MLVKDYISRHRSCRKKKLPFEPQQIRIDMAAKRHKKHKK